MFAVLTWGRPPVAFIHKKAYMHTYVAYRSKKKKGKRKEGQGTPKRGRKLMEEETRRIKPTWKF